jgi:hypothetical protein
MCREEVATGMVSSSWNDKLRQELELFSSLRKSQLLMACVASKKGTILIWSIHSLAVALMNTKELSPFHYYNSIAAVVERLPWRLAQQLG